MNCRLTITLCTFNVFHVTGKASSDLQLPLQQWGAGNGYLLVLSKAKKVNIVESLIAVMRLQITWGKGWNTVTT